MGNKREEFIGDHEESVILLTFMVLCVLLPIVRFFFNHMSENYATLTDRYLKLKAASHVTLCLTSFIVVGYLIWMFGEIYHDRQHFVKEYANTTRTVLIAYLLHAHSLSHRESISFSRLLLLALESTALLWGFFWAETVEPGVLFVIINGPCVRSMLWITMYDVLAQQEESRATVPLANPPTSDVAPFWWGAFGWSVFCLVGSGVLLGVYMVEHHKILSDKWLIALPCYFVFHALCSLPFFHRFWSKGQDQAESLEQEQEHRQMMSKGRLDFWLR